MNTCGATKSYIGLWQTQCSSRLKGLTWNPTSLVNNHKRKSVVLSNIIYKANSDSYLGDV